MMRKCELAGLVGAGLAIVLSAGCKRDGSQPEAPQTSPVVMGEVPMSIMIQSPAFEADGAIPARFTGDGKDISPAVSWSGVPADAKELALVVDDPDAPVAEPWVHWVICKIPADISGLPENVSKAATPLEVPGALQGKNSWGKLGYGGPAPPRGHGVHHYHFELYALDAPLDALPGLDKKQLLAKMKGHIIGQGEIVGTYAR